MDLLYAIPLLIVLVVGLYAARRAIQRSALRRRKAERARRGRPTPRSFTPLGTKRSQMRTDDDPTTIMDRITESKPTNGSGKKSG
jgi:hypothetical protein